MRAYKVRRNSTGAALNLPPEIAQVVPRNAVFTPELCEEGILYRYVSQDDAEHLPRWVRPRQEGDDP
jgi:hypothetical protein